MELSLRKNKKGAAFDIIFLAISIFALAVFFLIIWQVWADINPTLYSTLGTSVETNASIAAGTQLTTMFDFMFLGSVGALFIVMIIIALLIPANPIFYIVYFIYLIAAAIISPILSHTYEAMTNDTNLAAASAGMAMQGFFMENITIIIIVFGIVLITATYAKFGTGGAVR